MEETCFGREGGRGTLVLVGRKEGGWVWLVGRKASSLGGWG